MSERKKPEVRKEDIDVVESLIQRMLTGAHAEGSFTAAEFLSAAMTLTRRAANVGLAAQKTKRGRKAYMNLINAALLRVMLTEGEQ